tara:strand:- start:1865 stop:2320 length:456 start_codon:yes stop_codon:yes gene_type:complete
MANQNPQPEIYTTTHFFNGTAEGATDTQTVFTQQANNEEVRIYGFRAVVVNAQGAYNLAAQNSDFDMSIQIGNSTVPYGSFSIASVVASDTLAFTFACPILVLFNQPISITMRQRGSTDPTTAYVKVSFDAELSLQQVNCLPGEAQFPRGA